MGVAIARYVFFNIPWLIPSGPDTSFTLRLLKTSMTSDESIIMLVKDELVLLLNSGRLMFELSIVEIEQK